MSFGDCNCGSTQADSAPQQVLCWDSWDMAAGQQQPVGLRLVEYFAAAVDGTAAASGAGPYLRTTYMAPFRAVVAAHRKSNDEHIRVTGLVLHCPSQLVIESSYPVTSS